MDPLAPGVPVDTHTGTALLTGVSLRDAQFLRRGPIEAAGAGVVLQNGDVAIRCNFATIEKEGDEFLIKDRRAGRLREEEVAELAKSLQKVDLGDGITRFDPSGDAAPGDPPSVRSRTVGRNHRFRSDVGNTVTDTDGYPP